MRGPSLVELTGGDNLCENSMNQSIKNSATIALTVEIIMSSKEYRYIRHNI